MFQGFTAPFFRTLQAIGVPVAVALASAAFGAEPPKTVVRGTVVDEAFDLSLVLPAGGDQP